MYLCFSCGAWSIFNMIILNSQVSISLGLVFEGLIWSFSWSTLFCFFVYLVISVVHCTFEKRATFFQSLWIYSFIWRKTFLYQLSKLEFLGTYQIFYWDASFSVCKCSPVDKLASLFFMCWQSLALSSVCLQHCRSCWLHKPLDFFCSLSAALRNSKYVSFLKRQNVECIFHFPLSLSDGEV